MRLGLAYNQKPDGDGSSVAEPPSSNDRFAEWDDAATINAVAAALGAFGPVIRLEADASFPRRLADADVDLVFNMAEGLDGPSREAHVPAICEFLGVPYSGSDPLTLCLALHKGRAKEVFAARRIPTPRYAVVERLADLDSVRLPFPLFVKPVHEGSSKGIRESNYCVTPAALRQRVEALLSTYEQPVLVEEFLPGDEFTVAVLGTGEHAWCLPPVAISFDDLPEGAVPVYGYEAKWIWDAPERPLNIFTCPAPLDAVREAQVRTTALAAYRALGCRDWGRVDLRCDDSGRPHGVEVNPLPGILPQPEDNSCFPKAARAGGLSYDELIQMAARLAWRRVTGADLVPLRVEVA